MNILIVKMSALGDVTHTLPALTTLRRHHPDAHIAWLVEEMAADIVQGHPMLNRVIVWPRRALVMLARSGRWLAAGRLLAHFLEELRDTRYDLIVDFQGLLKSALWVFLARGVRKAGYGPGMRHREGSWLVLNVRVPPPPDPKHAIDRNLLLLEGLGIPRYPLLYAFPIPPDAEREAQALLEAAGVAPEGAFVAVHPVSRWPTKNWGPDRFAQMANALTAQGLAVVWTGGPTDRPVVDAICGGLRGKAHRVDGLTKPKTLAGIFRRARVVVSEDTGPMHVAAAVGAPVVALFGPTSPQLTGPYGGNHTVLRVDLDCSPCFRRKCRTRHYEEHACMRRLEVEDVVRVVIEQAARARAPAAPG